MMRGVAGTDDRRNGMVNGNGGRLGLISAAPTIDRRREAAGRNGQQQEATVGGSGRGGDNIILGEWRLFCSFRDRRVVSPASATAVSSWFAS